jgi:hypothetical protein
MHRVEVMGQENRVTAPSRLVLGLTARREDRLPNPCLETAVILTYHGGEGEGMSLTDIIALVVLLLAYGLTWLLFLRSMRIIKFIDRENLKHMRQIRERLDSGRATTSPKGDAR